MSLSSLTDWRSRSARDLTQPRSAVDRPSRSPAPARLTGGLSPGRLRQVWTYLDAHLDQDLCLATLAGVIDLSPKHFARAFKQSTGLPPHQWVLRRRVSRAMDLLASAGPSLIDIALSCGFADQSHFTATFKKITGVTPGRYRADRLD